MGDHGIAPCDSDAMKVVVGHIGIDDSRETLEAKDEEIGGKWITLAKTPGRRNLANHISIDLKRVSNRENTFHDEVDPPGVEA